ncbi:Predicted PurR-regulated permease PerM [Paenibacillus sp. 1_12]|uniref:AI-2E family transporter n=1 Tax=Paenibacillus sp. 1_12 TaxID=1566278 RepID=UPI0008DF6F75|nr:AI-2E family transporter [Paenibacillus sp. 1_12]SFL94060.1 Predicted PurR-regulated permease PerM [Paenibacillus sp. 1_12]
MLQNKFFRLCFGIILVLIIINLMDRVGYLFSPLLVMFQTLFVPILISGFLYYMIRPLVHFLEKKGIKRAVGTLLIYFVITSLAVLFVVAFGPMLQTQIQNFVANVPDLVESTKVQIEKLQQNRLLAAYFTKDHGDLSTKISEYVNNAITYATNYLSDMISFMTSILLLITTIPIILYYLLIGGHRAMENVIGMLPKGYTHVARETLEEIDGVLSGYIIGRILISVGLGALIYVGFLVIGLPYPLLLAIIIAFTNLIPFIGPIIGAVPALIVAFTQSYPMMLWVGLLIVVAQQLDDTLLAPHVFGKRMDVHPLTIVLLLLVGENLAGIMGMLLAIPIYMVVKIVLMRMNRLFVFRYE